MGQGFRTEHLMTIGADFTVKEMTLGSNDITLQIYDIAGQERFESVRKRFLNNVDGSFIVFDLTRKDTLEHINKWVKEVNEQNKSKDIPLIFIGNKVDLKEERELSSEEIETYIEKLLDANAGKNSIHHYLETSAITGENIEDGFDKLVAGIMSV